MRLRFSPLYLLLIPALCLAAFLVYNLPFVHERVAWRVDQWRTQLVYAVNPPEQVEFVPQGQSSQTVRAGLGPAPANSATPTVTPTLTPNPTLPVGDTSTPAPTFTPVPSPTPLPASVRLEGVRYEDQHGRLNYCGPSNLSMALTFWGWEGDRDVVGSYVKTNDKDKNVMPYELQDFVTGEVPGLSLLIRHGGEVELFKKLLASGFPVIAEKGYYTYDLAGKYSWLGHYQLVTGYDDAKGVFIVQDTYEKNGNNLEVPYEDFIQGWRPFDFLFMVAYPYERQDELLALLGDYADPDWASQHALEIAQREVQTLSGQDQYFAAFNVGTSHVNLRQYGDASYAYDYAFQLYNNLPDDGLRPYRMLWYQTGPYFAYYYSTRYQDVIDLANATFDTIDPDVLEESFYWRGMAFNALGYTDYAIADFRESLALHPGFSPTLYQLEQMGVQP
jgi:tetratricopeptide (TPR) repeat protein